MGRNVKEVQLSTMIFVKIKKALETDGNTPILEDTLQEITKITPDLAKANDKHAESSDLPETKFYAAFISHKKVSRILVPPHMIPTHDFIFVFAFIRHTANLETRVQHWQEV